MRHLVSAVVLALAVAPGCGVSDAERTKATDAARRAYERARARGVDLSSGPCIADPIPGMPSWVADVAHDPRRPIDDEPENQCAAYRSGKADHFVELDPDGEVIRVE